MFNIGTDIESVERFKQLPYQENISFYSKIFSEDEIKTCLSKPNPHQSFTARFAAKESIIKAMHPLELSFRDIEIGADQRLPTARIVKPGMTNHKLKISLSHTEDYATAVVLVTKKD